MAESPPRSVGSAGTAAAAGGHVRGSTLLLAGRLVNVALDFVAQVVIVRYLAQSDYGAFAYGLSVASLTSSTAVLGLDKAAERFLPTFEERGEHSKVVGTVVMTSGAVLTVGLALVLAAYAMQGALAGRVVTDEQALSLLLILVFLSPLHAMGSLMTSMLAVFANARVIFFRRYILGPVLQLGVVLVVVGVQAGVETFALFYVLASLLGTVITAAVVLAAMRRQAILTKAGTRALQFPIREVFGFSLPLLVSDLVFVLRSSVAVILLEFHHLTTDVALFRAAVPIARQNLVVSQSFRLLFTPLAARLHARGDPIGLNELYWSSALWIAVLSFPVFALTFSLAGPITVLLYGDRYAGSAPILAILAVGNYLHGAAGFNGLVLRVYGRVRYIVSVDVVTTLVGLAAMVVLIREFGPMGAAIGVTGTILVQTTAYHVGLGLRSDIAVFEWRYWPIYAVIVGSVLGLALTQWWLAPPLPVGLLLAGLASVAVFVTGRRSLSIGRTFPALLQLPGGRWLFGE